MLIEETDIIGHSVCAMHDVINVVSAKMDFISTLICICFILAAFRRFFFFLICRLTII